MSFLGYGRMWQGPATVSPQLWAELVGEAIPDRGKRRTDRARVEAGRVSLAKLPGTVGRLTRAEVAAELGCSIRRVQRLEATGRLRACPRIGREVTYLSRDVRNLDLASGKGR